MKKLLYILIIIAGLFLLQFVSVQGATTLFPYQGGTGIGTVGVGDVGKCLIVSDDVPFTYTVGACGTGGGSSLHTDATTYIYPTGGKYHSAPYYTGTSTATASTFPLASTTALTTTRGYVTQLANLTSDGFVKTGSANGTLSIDTTTYESGLTASNGITRTINDFAPTTGYNIPLTSSTTNWQTAYGWGNHATAGYDQVTTAGDGLTRTANDFDCDTASGSVFGCLSSANWTTFNGKQNALSVTHPIRLIGDTLSLAFSTTTANAWSLLQSFTYASTTGISGTNLNFTSATSTSFFSTLGTFTNAVINTLLTVVNLTVTGVFDLVSGANPTVDAEGEMALNTTTKALSIATSTTALELPLAPQMSFAYASSSWTGTTTEISRPTGATFDELITTGICYANGTGKIHIGNGTASSTIVSLSAGTTTVDVNQRFNKNGTRIIFAMGTPTTLSTVNCTFDRYYLR